jgi:hypothetical protein
LLWGTGTEKAQVIETTSPQLDFEVKNSGYQRFIKEFNLKDESKKYTDDYYKEVFKLRESFRSLLERLK